MTYKDKLEREYVAQLSDNLTAKVQLTRPRAWGEIEAIATDNLDTMHLETEGRYLARRFGVADMVIADMYIEPVWAKIIVEGERLSTRIRYSGRICDLIQEHEFWFNHDTWLVWYNSLVCEWECDYVPF